MIKIPDYKDISHASKQVATNSAMNPILWKTAISFPFGVVCCLFAPTPLNYIILAVGSIPMLIGVVSYGFFVRNDPDRLQSETHIENMEILARMSGDEPGSVITIDSQPVANNAKQIGHEK